MRLNVVDPDRCVGCQSCMYACSRVHGQAGLARQRITVRSAGGMERGFVVIVCRACAQPPCSTVCPHQALARREEGGVKFAPELCTGCGFCRRACPVGAVFWDDAQNKPMICVYCGYCAKHCPHEVLSLQRKGGDAHAG